MMIIYTLREIQEEYLPKLTPYVKNQNHKKRGRKTKVEKLYTLYNLHYNRLLDLVKLAELRDGYCRDANGQLIDEGQREFMCFLYRYWSNCFTGDKEQALINTLEFNSKFKKPLMEREVETVTASADKAYDEWLLNDFALDKFLKGEKSSTFYGYNYKNATLIELLNITKEEMMGLNTIIDAEEKRRRDKENKKASRRNGDGETKREMLKEKRKNEINDLKKEGLSYRKIAKELDISLSTVYRNLYG